jgi:hypothetical protein
LLADTWGLGCPFPEEYDEILGNLIDAGVGASSLHGSGHRELCRLGDGPEHSPEDGPKDGPEDSPEDSPVRFRGCVAGHWC